MTDIKKWALGLGLSLILGAAFIQADARWLRKIAFDEYQQAQVQRENQAELRALDRRMVDVQSELEFGNPTPERKAQLEMLLKLLQAQAEELKSELGQ
jgi:hypothetical protein